MEEKVEEQCMHSNGILRVDSPNQWSISIQFSFLFACENIYLCGLLVNFILTQKTKNLSVVGAMEWLHPTFALQLLIFFFFCFQKAGNK